MDSYNFNNDKKPEVGLRRTVSFVEFFVPVWGGSIFIGEKSSNFSEPLARIQFMAI